MSASLVGSEMCIRDSFCTAPMSAQRSEPPSKPSIATAMQVARGAGILRCCLLYTSDAADDM
eukprot:6013313-Alexandrium_andersonii.AAC.1